MTNNALSCLDITEFCQHPRYRLSGLTRVNLIVGPNGVGKSELLRRIGCAHHDPPTCQHTDVSPQHSDIVLMRWKDLLRAEPTHYSAALNLCRIVEPNLLDILVTKDNETNHQLSCVLPHAIVRIDRMSGALQRLLWLSINLELCGSWIVTIDNIDRDLHWTAMAEMWRYVVRRSIERDLQVFCTTHSHDCMVGLARICRDENPNQYLEAISLHRIGADFDHSVDYDGVWSLSTVWRTKSK